MENSLECVEVKTPRRTRRSSVTGLESASKKTRSIKKVKMPEIEENEDITSGSKTPSRSVKQIEFQTPNKSEVTTLTQTPRRSARKSIKPVQEYENIIAQKGVKRVVVSTLDEEDPTVEGKWAPAVIGRASTKRNKKPGRGKNKNLKRQRRLTEDSEDNDEGTVERQDCDVESEDVGIVMNNEKNTIIEEPGSELESKENDCDSNPAIEFNNELLVEKKIDHATNDEPALRNESLDKEDVVLSPNSCKTLGEDKIVEDEKVNVSESPENANNIPQMNADLGNGQCEEETMPAQVSEIGNVGEKSPEEIVEEKENETERKVDTVTTVEDVSVKFPEITLPEIVEEKVNEETSCTEETECDQIEKVEEDTTEILDNQKKSADVENTVVTDASNDSDNSMESGDVELAEMPITADDSMDSPKEETTSSLADGSDMKSLNVSGVENADDSDCIMLSLDESTNTVKSENFAEESSRGNKLLNESTNSTDMPSLMVCSDDEDLKTVKTEEIKVEQIENVTETDEPTKFNSTFDQSPEKNTTIEDQHTPALRASTNHVPTPFKSKTPIIPDIIIEPEEDMEAEKAPTIVEESIEKRIKSVRKRSFSVCGDRPKRNVTFFSPANTTISIYDGDLLSSCRKGDSTNKPNYRKRSLSVTETEKEMIAYIKEQKNPDTPDSKKKGSRIKMPNFSAIHQHQFKKMESISDHVARKAERAKILSNSALKARPASVQKGLPVKNAILRDSNKDSKTNLQMPKARQRIELSGIEHKPKAEQTGWLNVGMKIRAKSRNDLTSLDDLPSIDKLYKFNTNSLVFSAATKPKLPKPRMDPTVTTTGKHLPCPTKTVIPAHTATEDNGCSKPDLRPKFNLSTAPESQSFRSTESLNDRRKRLMDMYKSRNHTRAGEKNREILKGVRTNRRFELQMMCRNRPN